MRYTVPTMMVIATSIMVCTAMMMIIGVSGMPRAALPEVGFQIHSYDDLREW
jgi:hypothetical protein